MARLLPEQLEFDFFAPPTEQVKKPEKIAASAAFKDADILKFQFNKDGSRKLEDFGEDLNNTRKGRSVHKKATLTNFSLHLRMRLKNGWLQSRWIESGLKRPFSICISKIRKQRLVFGLSELH